MSKNKLKQPKKIKRLSSTRYRLSIKKSNLQIYAQIIDDKKRETVTSASSLKLSNQSKLKDAEEVGKLIGQKAKKLSISSIYFDRSNKYIGRLSVLCNAIREQGIIF
jgi:large subunit ribosomal protein L18